MTRLIATRTRFTRVSVLLLVAIFPMLSFMGHWPASVSIPGTNLYVSVPLAGGEAHDVHNPESAAEHGKHCHGGAASCGDAPAGAGVTLAIAQRDLSFAVGAVGLIALAMWGWQPLRGMTIAPEPRPPRALLSPA